MWRVGTEFFSGMLGGAFLGYGIDHLWATQPWGIVGMILLGFLAGFRNIYRLFHQPAKGHSTSEEKDKDLNA